MNLVENLLTTLSEECVEIIKECTELMHRCSKALRFGLSEIQPEQAYNNAQRIISEYDDLRGVVERLQELHHLPLSSRDQVEAKKAKLDTFLSLSEKCGTINPLKRAYSGIILIDHERRRQIQKGWAAEHDDSHIRGELAKAATCYAYQAWRLIDPHAGCGLMSLRDLVHLHNMHWPFEESWWKPSEDPIRNLEKAGALIAAEIDRLIRLGGGDAK